MIVLVGFMGAGKTTVGTLLAAALALPFADSDQVIERRDGRPVRQIFAEDGEPAFRASEHRVVAELLGAPDPKPLVLALGGGAPEHPATREALAAVPHVAYLHVGYEQALARAGGDADPGSRPLLARPDLRELYQRRLAVYAAVATLTVATDGRTARAVAGDIASQIFRTADAARPGLPLTACGWEWG
ncbi:MAG: shikimate kinase [Streptosporangiaceae bacterium]|nr:shikimate kinase [Streptosporangiaceae bacterium]